MPKLLETFDQLKMSSEIRSTDPLSFSPHLKYLLMAHYGEDFIQPVIENIKEFLW